MIHRLHTKNEHRGLRLDLVLSELLPSYSRGEIRRIIELGGVHVAGRRTMKCGKTLAGKEKIEVYLDGRSLAPYRLCSEDVVFQDNYLIVLNKPAGVETQPTPARYRGTLYEALQRWLDRDRRFGKKLHIGMAQRLDRDTSGLIAFSIHPQAHKGLTEQFQQREAQKTYLALIHGEIAPAEGEFRSFLARNRRTGLMKTVSKGGREAVTRYGTVESRGEISLVEVVLVSGRMHQIRAHFAEAGHSLVGDLRYGGEGVVMGRQYPRQCLHSYRLSLSHPVSGVPLDLTAVVPSDMDLHDT